MLFRPLFVGPDGGCISHTFHPYEKNMLTTKNGSAWTIYIHN